MKRDGRSTFTGWLWPVLCLILAVIVLVLAWQNMKLKAHLAAINDRFSQLMEGQALLKPGDPAPPFTALLPGGQELIIRTDSLIAPLILGWYSGGCEPCLKTIEPWNELADSFPGQFWGITIDTPEENDGLSGEVDRDFPTVSLINDTAITMYKIQFTPQTMVISPAGIVAGIWPGPLTPQTTQQVIALIRHNR